MAVVGSLHGKSVTKVVVNHVAEGLREAGCEVDLLDLANENLPLVNTDTTFSADYYGPLAQRVKGASKTMAAKVASEDNFTATPHPKDSP